MLMLNPHHQLRHDMPTARSKRAYQDEKITHRSVPFHEVAAACHLMASEIVGKPYSANLDTRRQKAVIEAGRKHRS
jgi:hypothetical protein